MLNMSTYSLRELRTQLGAIIRGIATSGDEAIITDSGSEVAAIISMADYERLHEHADIADALRLQTMRSGGFATMELSQMLDALGVDATSISVS